MKKKKKKKRKEEEFLPSNVAEILRRNRKIIREIATASKATAKSRLHFPEKVRGMWTFNFKRWRNESSPLFYFVYFAVN